MESTTGAEHLPLLYFPLLRGLPREFVYSSDRCSAPVMHLPMQSTN